MGSDLAMTVEMNSQIPVMLDLQQPYLLEAQLLKEPLTVGSQDGAQMTSTLTQLLQGAWSAGISTDDLTGEPKALNCCIRFVDEVEGQSLNHQFRGRESATNVLSFETAFVDEAECRHLGDLVLCVPVLVAEAAMQGKTLQAHCLHLALHGILHLIGYDHQTADGRRVMEALEIKLLNEVGIANPYEVTGNE